MLFIVFFFFAVATLYLQDDLVMARNVKPLKDTTPLPLAWQISVKSSHHTVLISEDGWMGTIQLSTFFLWCNRVIASDRLQSSLCSNKFEPRSFNKISYP